MAAPESTPAASDALAWEGPGGLNMNEGPLLPPLLPLAGSPGILGVALSGAGPAVLVIVEDEQSLASAAASIRIALAGFPEPELKMCSFQADGAESLASHEPIDAS